MMPEEFEQKLSSLRFREIPAEWEQQMLAAAREKERRSVLPGCFEFLRALLWPHPGAWAGIAAIWLVIATLNFSGPRGDQLTTTGKPTVPPDPAAIKAEIAALRVRDALLALWSEEPEFPPRHRL